MEFGDVERFEIVVRRFDFWPFDYGEADGDEDVFDFLEDLADQMMRADGKTDAGEREVEVLTGEGRLVGTGFDGLAARFDLRFDVGAKCIEPGAYRAFQVGWGGFQPVVGDLGEDAGFAA